MDSKVRFGVIVEGNTLVAWQARCIKDMVDHLGGAHFELLVSTTGSASAQGKRCSQRRRRRYSLWRWVEVSATKKIVGLHPVDWRREFPDAHEVVAEIDDAGRLGLPTRDYAELGERGLKFLLNFTGNEVAPALFELATAGVWSFQLNDATKYDGLIPGFWELYRGDKLIRCALVRCSRSGITTVLREGTFRSVVDSYVGTASTALDACVPWPRLAWQQIARKGQALDRTAAYTCAPAVRAEPSSFQVLIFLTRLWSARLRLMFKWWFFREQWCVGIVDKPIHAFIGATTVENVNWLFRDERHRYFADPFGIANGSEVTILAEEYPATTNRGKISSFVVRDGAVVRSPAVVLERDGHLSYPYLFRHGDTIYCVPESNELSEITLYQITRFPDQWKKIKTLLHGKYVDPTVIRYDERWWLFASSMEHEGVTTLYIWHATDLLGEWTPHPGNPVKSDVSTSRPAGTPFVHEGRLYRPAQNCGNTYGGGVALNRVTRLTEDEFEEELVTHLQPESPGPFPLGLHTLSAVGDRTLIDGKTYLFSIDQFRDVLRAKLRRIF